MRLVRGAQLRLSTTSGFEEAGPLSVVKGNTGESAGDFRCFGSMWPVVLVWVRLGRIRYSAVGSLGSVGVTAIAPADASQSCSGCTAPLPARVCDVHTTGHDTICWSSMSVVPFVGTSCCNRPDQPLREMGRGRAGLDRMLDEQNHLGRMIKLESDRNPTWMPKTEF